MERVLDSWLLILAAASLFFWFVEKGDSILTYTGEEEVE